MTTGGTQGESPEAALSILLVDDDAVTDAVVAYATGRADIRVTTAADESEARELVAGESVDCLVADPDALGVYGAEFVAEVRETAPHCPVVWLTGRDPQRIEDDVLSAATTIVEKSEDHEDWSFLVEKVRGAVQSVGSDHASDDVYRRLVEAAGDGLYRLDANGEVVYLNEAFAEMLGYDREELLGVHASTVMREGELERGQQVVQEVMAADDAETELMELEMVTREGEPLTVSVHFAVLTTDEGAYDGLVGVVRDITERKERERALERQNERLEEFASVLGHDLRSPLSVATGNLQLARETGDEANFEAASEALDRMGELIDDLLALARQGDRAKDVEPVALGDLAEHCWRTVRTSEATLVAETDRTVRADRSRLAQLLENLFRNAVEHGGAGVTIRVGDLDDGFYVADDGPGIPEAERDRVFESGYSTTDTGTGFGLAIVREIAEAHGWEIAVTDSETGGARFEITGVGTAERSADPD